MTKLKITKNDAGDPLIYVEGKLLGQVTDFQLQINSAREGFDIVIRQAIPESREFKRHFLVGDNLELEADITKDHLKSLIKDS